MQTTRRPTTDDDAPTDWKTAVLEAIEYLEEYDAAGVDATEGQRAFGLKAAHDRLARLNTVEAPRADAKTIRDVADLLAEVPDVESEEWGVIAKTALAQLAPLAAKAARATPGPFFESIEDLPVILEPTPAEREQAEAFFGTDQVPDGDAIPDYSPWRDVPVEIEVSEFILDVARRRLEKCDNPDRKIVFDTLVQFVNADEQYRTPDGRDAVEMLLEEQEAESDGGVDQ